MAQPILPEIDVRKDIYKEGDEEYISDFLNMIFSVSLSLRKMKPLILEFRDAKGNITKYPLRSQTHLLVSAPFGAGKSGLVDSFREVMDDGKILHVTSTLTKASVFGSINVNGEFNPPIFTEVGGGILCVDEWDSVTFDIKEGLLGIMSSQKLYKRIAYPIKKTVRKGSATSDNQYVVKGSVIQGRFTFTLIAFSMGLLYQMQPVELNKMRALLSRFCFVYIPTDAQYRSMLRRGKIAYHLRDVSESICQKKGKGVDTIQFRISWKTMEALNDIFDNYLFTYSLNIIDDDLGGYENRVRDEWLRWGMGLYLIKYHDKGEIPPAVVVDVSTFKDCAKFIEPALNSYINLFGKSAKEVEKDIYSRYIKAYRHFGLKKEGGLLTYSEMGIKLGVSASMIMKYKRKYESSKKVVFDNDVKSIAKVEFVKTNEEDEDFGLDSSLADIKSETHLKKKGEGLHFNKRPTLNFSKEVNL